jgi:hypothetical protein
VLINRRVSQLGEYAKAFADRKLDRLTKEILAFAAWMTAKSDYGVDLQLRPPEC